jgi:hypothetical protein
MTTEKDGEKFVRAPCSFCCEEHKVLFPRVVCPFWCEEQAEYLKTGINNTEHCDSVLNLTFSQLSELNRTIHRYAEIMHVLCFLESAYTTYLSAEEKEALDKLGEIFDKGESEVFHKLALWVV